MRKAANNKIKVSGKDMTLQILIYICMALAVFICIYPFWYLVIYSLSDSGSYQKDLPFTLISGSSGIRVLAMRFLSPRQGR